MRGKKKERLIKLNKRSILIEYPVYSTIIVFLFSMFPKIKKFDFDWNNYWCQQNTQKKSDIEEHPNMAQPKN